MRYLCLSVLLLATTAAVHASAYRTIATVGVGTNPNGVGITPDGRFAYIANNGGTTVSVIDVATNTVVTTIAGFSQPYTITMNALGTKAYITNSDSTTISIVDTGSNTITGTITGFDGPSGMVITPDGSTAYVNNYGALGGAGSGNATTIRVVNLNTNTIVGSPIYVSLAPAALAITPDGAYVYVACYVDGNLGTGTVSIIKTSTNTVVKTIMGFSGPFSILITPDGSKAYVANFGSNNFDPCGTTVSVIDTRSNTIISTISLGLQPSGLAITPDGNFVYVTIYNTLYLGPGYTLLTAFEGTVNVINTYNQQVLSPVLLTGGSPSTIAITPDGTRAYVTNYNDNTVTVFNITDQMWLNA